MKHSNRFFNIGFHFCDMPLYSIEKTYPEFGFGFGVDFWKFCFTFSFTNKKQFEARKKIKNELI